MKTVSLACIQFLFIVALVSISQTSAADDETLVLYLKLNEGKGKNVKDSSSMVTMVLSMVLNGWKVNSTGGWSLT